MDWFAAFVALRVVGAVLVVLLQCGCKICTILQPVGSKGQYLKKCSKHCWPIKSKETWTKYTLHAHIIKHLGQPSSLWRLWFMYICTIVAMQQTSLNIFTDEATWNSSKNGLHLLKRRPNGLFSVYINPLCRRHSTTSSPGCCMGDGDWKSEVKSVLCHRPPLSDLSGEDTWVGRIQELFKQKLHI